MLDDFSTELKRLGGAAVLTLGPMQESHAAEKDQGGLNEVENRGSTSQSRRDILTC